MKPRLASGVFCLLGALGFLGCSGEKGEECTPDDRTVCKEGVVYWVDSCGNQGDKAANCECGCNTDFSGCKDPCECVPDCQGKECGSDGCGSACPPGCGPGQTCVNGACEGECIPDCTGKCCGNDRCGGDCLDECADTQQTCNTQTCLCEGSCTPNCDGKDCGPDGCGDECGTCNPGFDCEDGGCVCNHEVCGDVCCAEGETCENEECCMADCTGKQCGTDCAGTLCGVCGQGSFCSEYQCIQAGVEDCWTGEICPPEHPYCLMSCSSGVNKCCEVLPDHPRRIDGTINDTCEVCCVNPEFTNPVEWAPGDISCCATAAPYPFLTCETQDRMCCPQVAQNPRRCDGSTDESCNTCCSGTEYPIGVIFPDGHTSCCPETHPWPCVQNGTSGCCADPGSCG